MSPRAHSSRPDPDDDPFGVHDEGFDRGVEHLQAAAHEMLAAARSFLDAVEDVVSDRDKLNAVAATVTDLLSGAGSSLARVADKMAGAPHAGAAPEPGAQRPRIRRIDIRDGAADETAAEA